MNEEYKKIVLPSDEEALKKMKIKACECLDNHKIIEALVLQDEEKLAAIREKFSKIELFNADVESRYLAADEDGKKRIIGSHKHPQL
jgi:hypothetical protein